MNSNHNGPINLGNENEYTIKQIANVIRDKVNQNIHFINLPLPQDDPLQRKPDIKLAKQILDWHPKINLEEGINKTVKYFKESFNHDN